MKNFDITLIADGVEVPLPADSQGIILLNIDSYAGGVPLWSHGTKERSPMITRQNSRESLPFGRRPDMRRSKSLEYVRFPLFGHYVRFPQRFARSSMLTFMVSCRFFRRVARLR